jgi:hypothetical protein
MQANLKHITLVCSNAGQLASQQALLAAGLPAVSITVAGTIPQLEEVLSGQLPDLIILLQADNGESAGDNFLHSIRKNERLDDTPLFVYAITEDKNGLADWLKKWRKAFSYFPL